MKQRDVDMIDLNNDGVLDLAEIVVSKIIIQEENNPKIDSSTDAGIDSLFSRFRKGLTGEDKNDSRGKDL